VSESFVIIIEKKSLDLSQEQIRNELESVDQYLGTSAYFESSSENGFVTWTRKQAKEETEHAAKLFDDITDPSNHVELFPIAPMSTH
jgi:ferritin